MFPKYPRKPVGSILTSHKTPAIPHLTIPLYSTFRLKMPEFPFLTGKMPTEPSQFWKNREQYSLLEVAP